MLRYSYWTSFIASVLLFTDASAQSGAEYHRDFDEEAASAHSFTGTILRSDDDGYYLSIVKMPVGGQGSKTLLVIRIDCSGDLLWSHTYELTDTLSEGLLGCQMAIDQGGNLLLSTVHFSSGYVPLLIKLNDQGDVLWTMTRTESSWAGNTACAIDGYYFTQTLQGSDDVGPKGIVSKVGFDGTTIWSKHFGAGTYDRLTKILVLSSSEPVVAGYSQVTTPDTLQGFTMTKLHSDGSHAWSFIYPADIAVIDMVEDYVGNLILTGTGYGNTDWGFGSTEMVLIKLSSDGELIWAREYGGYTYDEGFTVHIGKNNNYVMCAEPESFSSKSQASLISTSVDGDFQWMKLYGDTAAGSFPFGAVQNGDSGFTIFGINASYWGSAPLYLTRTGPDGSSCDLILDTVPGIGVLDFARYPLNPLTDATPLVPSTIMESDHAVSVITLCSGSLVPCHINTTGAELTNAGPMNATVVGSTILLPRDAGWGIQTLDLFDLNGQRVVHRSFTGSSVSVEEETRFAANGLYFYRLVTSNGRSFTGKMQGHH